MFSRKSGHYPPESVYETLTSQTLPLQQPPLCVGKSLNFPPVLPQFKHRKVFSHI